VLAVTAGVMPMLSQAARATTTTTPNACTNTVAAGPSEIPMTLAATPPAAAPVGTPVTVPDLTVTAAVPAAFIQAAVNLHLLADGQSVSGTVAVDIAATNATPANVVLSGAGSGTVHAPGGVAADLSVVVALPTQQWTPTGVGDVTLAQALTGDLTATGPPGTLTDGSLSIVADVGPLTVTIICRPGTVSGTDITPPSSVTPFVTFAATTTSTSSASTTSTSSTTSTTSSTTTTTSSSSTTSTSEPSTTTTVPSVSTTTAPRGRPTITLSSSVALKGGDALVVSGSGFDPFAAIGLKECSPLVATAASPTAECDTSKVVLAASDGSGAFTSVVKVLQTGALAPYGFAPADPAATCPPAPGAANCVIVATESTNADQQALAPIAFAGAPPAAGATVLAARVSAPGTLPATGAGPLTLLLTGVALGLIDLGYLLVSATRPAPRPLLRRIGRR
jgi:hypothetical protein